MTTFQWTGNPFVDTGLCVVIARAREMGNPVQTVSDLTPVVLQKVVGDGSWLAAMNKRLKSYTMVFGKNGPLMQTGTNPLSQLESHQGKIAQAKQEILKAETEVRDLTEKLDAEADPRKREKLQKQIKAKGKTNKLQTQLAEFEGKLEAKKEKAARSFDRGVEEYRIVIQTLLEDILTGEHSLNTVCECSGIYKASRALSVASSRIREAGFERKKDTTEGILTVLSCAYSLLQQGNTLPLALLNWSALAQTVRDAETWSTRQDFGVGRDWFPLAGSFNDAQALPAASRSANLSALCLLAVQFLPLGVLLLNGRLACFQSNDVGSGGTPIFQYLVEDVYEQMRQRSEVQKGKLAMLGEKQGTTPTALALVDEFQKLQEYRRGLELPN